MGGNVDKNSEERLSLLVIEPWEVFVGENPPRVLLDKIWLESEETVGMLLVGGGGGGGGDMLTDFILWVGELTGSGGRMFGVREGLRDDERGVDGDWDDDVFTGVSFEGRLGV